MDYLVIVWVGAFCWGGGPGFWFRWYYQHRGCPVLRAVGEGREPRTHAQKGFVRSGQTLCRQHRYPPLPRTQGRGTQRSRTRRENWATRLLPRTGFRES